MRPVNEILTRIEAFDGEVSDNGSFIDVRDLKLWAKSFRAGYRFLVGMDIQVTPDYEKVFFLCPKRLMTL